ncbi:MAG TPA: ROK family protein [Cellulomonas sp.]
MSVSDTDPATVRVATPPRAGWSVGLDIGGSKVLGVLVGPDGQVTTSVRLPSRRGGAAIAGSAVEATRALADEAGMDVASLAGVGIGLPGIVDPLRGEVAHAVNLGVGETVPLAGLVAAGLGDLPVHLENDLNCAALGVAHLSGRPGADLAFLALGTGLAAGLLLDGTLRRGAHRAAGEIGHLVYIPDGRPCPCGQRGCLERYASGSALAAQWPTSEGVPAPQALFDAADAGDATATAVRDEFVRAVAAAVRLLVLTCDVGLVVLGGGVSELGERLGDRVRAQLAAEAKASEFLASIGMAQRVALAPAGVPVGAVGAALLGRREP